MNFRQRGVGRALRLAHRRDGALHRPHARRLAVSGQQPLHHDRIAGGLAANNNADLVPHLGHVVAVTGDVTSKGDTMTITASTLTMEVNGDS